MTITDEMVERCPCCGSDLSECAAINLYSDEMVERAASALYDHDWEKSGREGTPIPLLSLGYPEVINVYKARARAALEAALSGKEEK